MSSALELYMLRLWVLYLAILGITIIYVGMYSSPLTSIELKNTFTLEWSLASENQMMLDSTSGIRAKIIYEGGHVDQSTKVCVEMGQYIKLLIVITSAPANEKARMAIRKTWGHYATRKDIDIAFMVGSTSDKKLHDNVSKEQYLFEDIIRGKFIDTYENLTLKTISMLEWTYTNCHKATFILKSDDDVFIHVPRLLTFISKLKPSLRVIYGRVVRKEIPIRNTSSKYYISHQQYKPSFFPDFTLGPAYLFPSKLSKDLYLASLEHIYCKLEDVFLTGIVANYLKIKRMHISNFLRKWFSFRPCTAQQSVLTIHRVKWSDQHYIWKYFLNGD